jgi:hypothetical protein
VPRGSSSSNSSGSTGLMGGKPLSISWI